MIAQAAKVLLIDDEPDVLDISKQLLELHRSISVDTTISAADALKQLDLKEYDVIVSDYQMPGKDGIQLLKEIRGNGNRIPFILFTGKGREEVAIEALNSGADFYLQKGGQSASQFSELANMIKQACSVKRGERSLRISEERLRTYMDNAPEGIFVVDASGNYLDVNKTACSMLNYSRDELLRLNIANITCKSARQDVLKEFQQLKEEGTIAMEAILVRKDGIHVPVSLNAVELPNQRYMAFCADITGRKRAEEALRNSEKRYHQLFDHIGIGVAVYEATEDGRDFIFKDFNRGAQNIEKVEKEEVIGRKVTEVFPGVDEMGLLDVLRRVHQTGNPESLPISLYKEDGKMGFRENHVYRLPSGEVVAVFEDATVIKEMEGHIEHLASFPTLNPDPILELRAGVGLIYANPSSYQMIREMGKGGDPSLLLPKDVEVLLPKDIEDIIKALKDSGATHTVREVGVRGRVFKASILNVPWTDLVRVYETDITHRKHAEEALRKSEKKFHSVFDLANDAILLHTLSVEGAPSHFIEANQVACNLLGYSREELFSMGPVDIVPPERRPQLADIRLQAETKDAFLFETMFQRKDGTTVPVESSAHLVNFNGKKIWISHIRDITERKLAEEALRESIQRYQLVIDGSSACIWDSDVVKGRIHFSPQWKALRGYTDAEIGDSVEEWTSRIHPDDAPRVKAAMQAHLAGQTDVYEEEYRIICKDGSSKWVLDQGKAVRDATGRVIRNVGSEIDITMRKRAEEALRKSERRFEELAEQSGTVTWEIDTDGLITYLSGASETVWGGYRPEELVGKRHFYDLTPEAEREPFKAMIFELIKRRKRFVNLENPIKTKNGHLRWVSTNGIPLLNADGTLRGYQGSDTDITERKRAEEALKASESLYRLLANNSTDVIGIVDPNGAYTYVSPSVFQLRGYTPEEVLHQTLDQILTKESIPIVREAIKHNLEKVKQGIIPPTLVHELQQLRKDGSSVWVEAITNELFDATGKHIGSIVVCRDIAERKRAEDALHEVNRKLNLLSSITRHDIKNQLMVLDGNLTLLGRKDQDDASKELLRKLGTAINRILTMVQFTDEYENIGVHAPVWQNVRALVENEAKGVALGPIKLVNDVPPNIEMFADPLIAKVFHNLIDNAVRHGGGIDTIRFFVEEHDGTRAIICEDNGIGISLDMKKELFTHDSGKDHGFGLFLSGEILAITRMSIEEVGEPGKGAKFIIKAPEEGLRMTNG